MRVKEVRRLTLAAPVPVYDLTVPGTENFMLDAGVFVHNSKDCIAGSTRIPLLNGRSVPIKDLVGQEFWVYSSTEDGKVVPGRAHNVHKVGCLPVLQVTLDDGNRLVCTPDHEVMLRDGSFIEAKDLGTGDSLMPLYRTISAADSRSALHGYEKVWDNETQDWVFTHQMVAMEVHGFSYGRTRNERKVIHHKDFRKRNNSPENLAVMGWDEHRDYHNRVGNTNISKLWKDPEFRKRHRERTSRIGKVTGRRNITIYNKSPERIAKLRADGLFAANGRKVMTEIWNDPARRASLVEARSGKNNYQYREMHVDEILAAVESGHTKKKELLRFLKCNDRVFDRAVKAAGYTPYTFALRHLDRARLNHKVAAVKYLSEPVDVYDMTVDVHHNFAIGAGVFVHNCADAICGAYTNMLERKSTWSAAAADDVAFEEAQRAVYDERFEETRRI